MRNYFKTKKRLEIALANAHRIEGFEEYLQTHMVESHDIISDTHTISYELPYWLDPQQLDNVDPDVHDFAYEYIEGYQVQYPIVGDIVDLDEGEYEVIATLPLSEELELQTDSGELCYHYIGSSYLKIYQKLTD